MRNSTCRFLFFATALAFLTTSMLANLFAVMPAHPYHVCIAQATWNNDSDLWEISIRIHPQDLERSMAATQERASTEDNDFAEKVTRFLDREFFMLSLESGTSQEEVVKLADSMRDGSLSKPDASKKIDAGARSYLEWVGMENERGWLWLHFEMRNPKLDAETRTRWFVHRILIDEVERQENSLLVLPSPGTRYSLQFKKDAVVQRMK